MESGEAYTEIAILESGEIVRQKAMEYIFGRMETNMKVNGSNVLNMVMVLTFLQTGTVIRANTSLGDLMAMVNTNGTMEASTLENLRMVSSMERVNGGKITI